VAVAGRFGFDREGGGRCASASQRSRRGVTWFKASTS
jgi:hypothetical protein